MHINFMLKKLSNIKINPENPFENDCLNRKPFADKLEKLISSLSQPFVLALHSPWGTGKTEFIRMWTNELHNKKFPCIYFNAWENDHYEKPLMSFIGNFNSNLPIVLANFAGQQDTHHELLKTTKSALKKLAVPALKIVTRGALEADEIKELLSFSPKAGEGLTEIVSKIAEDQLKEYEKKASSINGFKEALQELRDTLDHYDIKHPFIFFVDELDRCRPTFALELLENIKHFFQSKGFLFILSIDKNQLSNIIRTIYGQKLDTDEYLRKFIDLEIILPTPDTKNFCTYLSRTLNLSSAIKSDTEYVKNNILYILNKSFSHFKIGLRTQSQIFTELIAILSLLDESDHRNCSLLVPFLLCLRAHNKDDFTALFDKELTEGSINRLIPPPDEQYEAIQYHKTITSHIMRHILTDDDYTSYTEEHKEDAPTYKFLKQISDTRFAAKSFEMINIISR
ncbi:MAG: KAP family P-loop NTPase fold protein [Thermodesulfobacteriota bacterium]